MAQIEGNMSTKDWLIRTVPLFLVLGVLCGWHDWSDHTYMTLIFFGVLVGLFEGEFLLDHLRDGQRQNRVLLERAEKEQRENKLLLERVEEEQRENRLSLERLRAEQEKLRRQQIRETILVEEILANMPLADKAPGDDCGAS